VLAKHALTIITYFETLIGYNLFLDLPVMLVEALMDKRVVERLYELSKNMAPNWFNSF
jgi:hypothetical protein